MSDSIISTLRECAADGGVETDELRLTVSQDTYTLSIAGTGYDDLSEDELNSILSEYDDHLEEWRFWEQAAPQVSWEWAFLRWIEDASERSAPNRRRALRSGVEAVWGEVLIRVRLANAHRVYELRHVDDRDRGTNGLTSYADPLDARQLAKYDDDGRYRPLSTAPSLQTGWVFSHLRAPEVVRAIDFFYPATIANWYREREGTLDITHWADATERQTGMYAVTEEVEGRPVDWVAEACCVDSQCLKRREWDERPGRPLSVPRGEGPFPCREPCSLVIAAARKWALLEQEEERTYTLQLTPSEKEQLEAVLAAVAEGRIADIREADLGNGANRYRARYLRAKRTDDEGRFTTGDDSGQ